MTVIRKPLLALAVVAMLGVVGVEIGSSWMIQPAAVSESALRRSMADDGLDDDEIDTALEQLAAQPDADDPPGLAIPALALIDGLLLVSVLGLGAALVIPHRVQGRIVAPANLVISLLLILAGIVVVLITLVLLFLMVGLLLAVPFGTIAYLARWGAFPRGEAQGVLAILLALKLAFCGLIFTASPRLLKQKGFMAMVITSFVLQLVVGFLQNLPPRPLVAIFDAVAAIVVVIVAIVWSIIILIGSLIGTLRLLRPPA